MKFKTKFTSKRERFEKLAIYRTNNVLHALKVLGNCANRSAYDYSEEDIKKIFRAVEGKVGEIKIRFKGNKKDNGRFEL